MSSERTTLAWFVMSALVATGALTRTLAVEAVVHSSLTRWCSRAQPEASHLGRRRGHVIALGVIWLGMMLGAPSSGAGTCVGDCDVSCDVTVDEIVTTENVALGELPVARCKSGDANGDGLITIDEIIVAVTDALNGCECPQNICGDFVVASIWGEECDDGGVCVGGTNAGTQCTNENQCQGSGICVGGTKPERGCGDDRDCPGGRCIHCRPFGGDGCAANCTLEHDVVVNLVPGELGSQEGLINGTSGQIFIADILTIPLPLEGSFSLTIGKPRDRQIPVVVKAAAMRFPISPIANLACACVRGIPRKTCGGTLLNADGTPSVDCTVRLTPGDSVCVGSSPCMSLHGEGNAMSGLVGCAGLDYVDYRVTQDAGGMPGAPEITFSGTGAPGSSVIFGTLAIGTVLGQCGVPIPDYGPDGQFCTADDRPNLVGVPTTVPLTTGTASAEVFNANQIFGNTVGPLTIMGMPLNCEALANGYSPGGTVVGALTHLAQPAAGDTAVTTRLAFQPGLVYTSTGSLTPTPPPTPTPTPLPVLAPATGAARW